MDLFINLMTWLRKLRVDRFVQILVTENELDEDMEIVAIIPAKRQRKRQYDESPEDFTPGNAEYDYMINCFNRIVDSAIQSLQLRFEQLKSNHNLFGFLIRFKSLQGDDIHKFAEIPDQA